MLAFLTRGGALATIVGTFLLSVPMFYFLTGQPGTWWLATSALVGIITMLAGVLTFTVGRIFCD